MAEIKILTALRILISFYFYFIFLLGRNFYYRQHHFGDNEYWCAFLAIIVDCTDAVAIASYVCGGSVCVCERMRALWGIAAWDGHQSLAIFFRCSQNIFGVARERKTFQPILYHWFAAKSTRISRPCEMGTGTRVLSVVHERVRRTLLFILNTIVHYARHIICFGPCRAH